MEVNELFIIDNEFHDFERFVNAWSQAITAMALPSLKGKWHQQDAFYRCWIYRIKGCRVKIKFGTAAFVCIAIMHHTSCFHNNVELETHTPWIWYDPQIPCGICTTAKHWYTEGLLLLLKIEWYILCIVASHCVLLISHATSIAKESLLPVKSIL